MTTKVTRNIVRIDEEKCDGCGLCIPQCKEGALQIIDGKARLVSEVYCDGLGACLGHCPNDAITVEEREAEEFDEEAVEEHLKEKPKAPETSSPHAAAEHGCPSARVFSFAAKSKSARSPEGSPSQPAESALAQWPVQLTLVPVSAPYLQGADLLIAADCVPFAYAGFHKDLLEGKALVIACPKLDDTGPYLQKLAAIFAKCDLKSITVAHMEVPCCFGLVNLVHEALKLAEKEIPVRDVTLSIQGEIAHDTAAK